MRVPDITHLQFLVLAALEGGEMKGRELRDYLAKAGHKKNPPAFYQFMARLEDAKLVKGRYEQKIVEGQIIKERVYTVTGNGVRACADVRDFYTAHGNLGLQGA